MAVEIRPKWDWKAATLAWCRLLQASWNQTKMGLKEINRNNQPFRLNSVEIRPKWDWKIVLMKLVGNFSLVEIRPKWDWKLNLISRIWFHIPCWNQTKMGLKVGRYILSVPRLFQVEIRPKWDWKLLAAWGRSGSGSVLKSDQNGIERNKQK